MRRARLARGKHHVSTDGAHSCHRGRGASWRRSRSRLRSPPRRRSWPAHQRARPASQRLQRGSLRCRRASLAAEEASAGPLRKVLGFRAAVSGFGTVARAVPPSPRNQRGAHIAQASAARCAPLHPGKRPSLALSYRFATLIGPAAARPQSARRKTRCGRVAVERFHRGSDRRS